MDGLLLVDKAKGASSFQVISKVRRALKTKSVGHTGTLDPLASGLLVVLVGRYTRLSNYLMASEKTYRAVIEFGTSTTTDDKEGEVVHAKPTSHIHQEAIKSVLDGFVGTYLQTPPAYSAISINGVRAYKLARNNEQVELSAREVQLLDIRLISYEEPILTIEVCCSKGTYIRALARDIGERLGSVAHLADLRRLSSGEYRVEDAIAEESLLQDGLARQNLVSDVTQIKGIEIRDISISESISLKQGKKVVVGSKALLTGVNPFLAVCDGEPIALCRIEEGQLVTVRGFG